MSIRDNIRPDPDELMVSTILEEDQGKSGILKTLPSIKYYWNLKLETGDKILIIDDEVQIRRLLEINLNLNGYKVSEASTAKEGIITAASHNPALILLDLRLPGSGCRFSSPSQRAITAVARQLPSTFTDVRAISINSSIPRII